MQPQTFALSGTPATFATSGEASWKTILRSQIPVATAKGPECGAIMDFKLLTLAPNGRPLDVDNLVEPVFAILVGQARWFGGARPGMAWWSATKQVGMPTGCDLTLSAAARPSLPTGAPTLDEVYKSTLPRSATSPEVAIWATSIAARPGFVRPSTCAVYLGFGSPTVNLGDISTGVVKSFVDCLYPILGGRAGYPEDHRVDHLIVEKSAPGIATDSVAVQFWYHGISSIPAALVQSAALSPYGGSAMNNPCRAGTGKWIVCEGALQQKSVADVQAELERLKPGTGTRINDYISDLRSENNLDVRRDGVNLRCDGQLRK